MSLSKLHELHILLTTLGLCKLVRDFSITVPMKYFYDISGKVSLVANSFR